MKSKKRLAMITQNIERECLGLRVRLLSRALTAIYDNALGPFGLTTNQFNVLGVLSKKKQATAKDLARIMMMDPSTLSRTLERMQKDGWVKGTVGEDARSHELSLTEKGWNLLEKTYPAWKEAQERALETLGPEDAAALNRVANSLWQKARNG